jgi:hypothetical protein
MANARNRWTDPPAVALTKLGPQVRCPLADPPAYLALWGRDPHGHWWALVAWQGYIKRDFHDYTVLCSGWVVTGDVSKVDNGDYRQVGRVRLGPDPLTWPRPWLDTDLHYPQLTRDQPAQPPTGAHWSNKRPSRRGRIPRYEQARPEDRPGYRQ